MEKFTDYDEYLNNFEPLKIVWQGFEFPTMQHAYQATKFPGQESKFLECKTPEDAIELAKTMEVRPDWDEIKFEVMIKLLEKTFNITDMMAKLADFNGNNPIEVIDEIIRTQALDELVRLSEEMGLYD